MITHTLKADSAVFSAVWSERKLFEFRKNDRGFLLGEWLLLVEMANGEETGRTVKAQISYILRGPDFGVPSDYCVMSLDPRTFCMAAFS